MWRFTSFVLLGLILCCSSSQTKIITNKLGNHSIEILPDWDYKFEKTSTRIGKSRWSGFAIPIPSKQGLSKMRICNPTGKINLNYSVLNGRHFITTQLQSNPMHIPMKRIDHPSPYCVTERPGWIINPQEWNDWV